MYTKYYGCHQNCFPCRSCLTPLTPTTTAKYLWRSGRMPGCCSCSSAVRSVRSVCSTGRLLISHDRFIKSETMGSLCIDNNGGSNFDGRS